MLGNIPKPLSLHMPSDLRTDDGEFYELPLRTPTTKDIPSQTMPSRGITRLTVDIPSSRSSKPLVTHPSRWRTPEFLFYGVCFCIVVPVMVWIPIQLSTPANPNYAFYEPRLRPGWLFGRKVDNSDAQYRSFRNNVPVLVILAVSFLSLKLAYTRLVKIGLSGPRRDNLYLIPFLVTFSLLFLLGLHGTSIIKILIILFINYLIAKYSGSSKIGPILTWVFNAVVLFANETYGGYKFASLHSSLVVLDSMQGVYPRWHVSFNITMLRLVSFNMDYFWACNGAGSADTGQAMAEKQRSTTPHSLDIYSFRNYVAYVLYPPLYIAGPIITFNNFLWQIRRPSPMPLLGTLRYLFRFLICILTMEFILHYMYVVAIKDTRAWVGASAAELSLIGFWNLIVVWLKLLVPWRFFRLWALADGIDPPENMVRCMVNNYSTMGFWRSWHRSYNLWIVRYIYIPLGGSKNVIFTTVLVFSFVALWHDLSFKLLAWGWLVSLFILPEILATFLLPASKYGEKSWYRHICAIGAVFNLLMMMTANLVGFVIGTDGIQYILHQLFSSWEGIRFLLSACVCMFIAIQVMFEYREEEKRRGIFRRC